MPATSRRSARTSSALSAGVLRAARAHALLLGRTHVLPEDVQTLFVAVAAHRLTADADGGDGKTLAQAILRAVPVD